MKDNKKEAINIDKKFFLVLILIAVLLSSCKSKPLQNSPAPEIKCVIQNCHGLEISCGQNAPTICTADYQLGDFCRKFTDCKLIDGKCQLDQNEKFEQCKSCLEGCKGLSFQKIFDCESDCRKKFE